jgi:hypothetical protein
VKKKKGKRRPPPILLTATERREILKNPYFSPIFKRSVRRARRAGRHYLVNLTYPQFLRICQYLASKVRGPSEELHHQIEKLVKPLKKYFDNPAPGPARPLTAVEEMRNTVFTWLLFVTHGRPEYQAPVWGQKDVRLRAKGIYVCGLDELLPPEEFPVRAPFVTASFYGPNDRRATKIILQVPSEDIVVRWTARDVFRDENILQAAREFLLEHPADYFVVPGGTIGCPHQEGLDYPKGLDCPKCPAWVGRQGSAAMSLS